MKTWPVLTADFPKITASKNPSKTFPSLISYWTKSYILYFAFPSYESESRNRAPLISRGRYVTQTTSFFTNREGEEIKQKRKQQTLKVKQFLQRCPSSPFHALLDTLLILCHHREMLWNHDSRLQWQTYWSRSTNGARFRPARWRHSPPTQKTLIHGIETAAVSRGAEGRCIGTKRESPSREGKSSFVATNTSLPHAIQCHRGSLGNLQPTRINLRIRLFRVPNNSIISALPHKEFFWLRELVQLTMPTGLERFSIMLQTCHVS